MVIVINVLKSGSQPSEMYVCLSVLFSLSLCVIERDKVVQFIHKHTVEQQNLLFNYVIQFFGEALVKVRWVNLAAASI